MEKNQYHIDVVSALAERVIKRLWVLVIILVLLLFGSNAAWLYYESQWDVVETAVTQENSDGINNFIGNDGDIYNGETDDQDKAPSP